jgi:hypothetical protein
MKPAPINILALAFGLGAFSGFAQESLPFPETPSVHHARRGTPPDTGTSHTGFRCVISANDWKLVDPVSNQGAFKALPAPGVQARSRLITSFISRSVGKIPTSSEIEN